ncbi:hypothetical protein Sjap_007527 [Stephania japonica]|uniref:Uncharacterized protein n=1 Tax=Stephania japonica TaxID=461633 RepID=A0AAP0JMV1_9MAGN
MALEHTTATLLNVEIGFTIVTPYALLFRFVFNVRQLLAAVLPPCAIVADRHDLGYVGNTLMNLWVLPNPRSGSPTGQTTEHGGFRGPFHDLEDALRLFCTFLTGNHHHGSFAIDAMTWGIFRDITMSIVKSHNPQSVSISGGKFCERHFIYSGEEKESSKADQSMVAGSSSSSRDLNKNDGGGTSFLAMDTNSKNFQKLVPSVPLLQPNFVGPPRASSSPSSLSSRIPEMHETKQIRGHGHFAKPPPFSELEPINNTNYRNITRSGC